MVALGMIDWIKGYLMGLHHANLHSAASDSWWPTFWAMLGALGACSAAGVSLYSTIKVNRDRDKELKAAAEAQSAQDQSDTRRCAR